MFKYLKARYYLIKFRRNDKALSHEIILINQLMENLQKASIHKYDNLLNACLYWALVNRDIYYFAEYYYFERNKSRKNFYGRYMCMSIVELFDDANVLLGKNLIGEFEQTDLKVFIPHLKLLNKGYAELRKKYQKEFKLIRNNAAAHKNKDSKLLLQYYTDLKIENLTEIGYDIGRLQGYFNDLTTFILSKINWKA